MLGTVPRTRCYEQYESEPDERTHSLAIETGRVSKGRFGSSNSLQCKALQEDARRVIEQEG